MDPTGRLYIAAFCAALAALLLAATPMRAQPPLAAPAEAVPSEGPMEGPPGGDCVDCYDATEWASDGSSPIARGFRRLEEMATRSTETHGRAVGFGEPLRGTSWLNRPYEVAVEFGALVMPSGPSGAIRAGNDTFAALQFGVDWDHYWGTQFRVGWSTPTLDNTSLADEETSDNFFIADLSSTYYPWGDSRVRPYWRFGVGLTDIEYATGETTREQQTLFTIPFGIGVKTQVRRWLAVRAELVDNLALGQGGADTMNNLTLTFGVEGRYGGRPSGYWAWSPRGYSY